MQADLWQSIRNGSTTAMKTLYQDCYQELYAHAFRILPDKEKVKDILHELFCELWDNRKTLSEVVQVKAYLKTSVRNLVLKQIKRDQQVEKIENQPEISLFTEYAYEQLLIESQYFEEQKLQIWSAINKLTPTQRDIISMKFYQGLSYEAIAARLQLKPRTIYNHVHMALSRLRIGLKRPSREA